MDFRKLSAFYQHLADRHQRELVARLHEDCGDRAASTELAALFRGDLYARLFELSHRVLITQHKLVEHELSFDDYCALLHQQEVRDYIHARYPVLQRCMRLACQSWLQQSYLLAKRFRADEPDIRRHLVPCEAPLQIESIRTGLGDTHRGGRSVAMITFRDGHKLLYKPRSLAIDTQFSALLDWLNRHCELDLAVANHIDRGAYGWVEFIACRDCFDGAQIDGYYRRLGGLLALLYVLEATDFHYENIIACADQPVLIDLESVFRPTTPLAGADANERYNTSVLKVGLLPTRFLAARGDLPEVGGLVDAAGQQGLERMLPVQDEDGRVRFSRERGVLSGGKNIPTLDGMRVAMASQHVAPLQQGFSAVYRTIMERRQEFRRLLEKCRRAEVRVLFRNTATYVHLLNESRHPTLMMSEQATASHFDLLRRVTVSFPAAEHFVEFEIADLLRGDVPQFTARVDGRDLWCGDDACVRNFFSESGHAAVACTLDRLSQGDLKRQLWMIGNAITMHEQQGRSGREVLMPPPGSSDPGSVGCTPLHERLVTLAASIGDLVRKQIHVEGDTASWLVHKPKALDNSEFALQPAFHDLHSGMPGEILFFQQLARITGEAAYRELAHQALHHLMQRLRESGASIRPLGLYAGWGSIIFLLTRMAQQECNFQFLDRAEELLGDPRFDELIKLDRNYGVVTGGAGFILACMELHASSASPRALELAQACAARLVAHRHPGVPGYGWRIHSSQPLSGLAHGASGFAMAFASLYGATGDVHYRQASLEALEYEASLFLPAAGNWRDCRDFVLGQHGEKPVAAVSWGHGAPGIGLARLALIRAGIDTPQIRRELDIAVQTTLTQGFDGGHSLLAGSFGNLELLLCHAHWCGDDGLHRSIAGVSERLHKQVATGDVRLSALLQYPLGLMPGITGVGYQCLRLADPDKVPSVLCGAGPLPTTRAARAGSAGANRSRDPAHA